jgi:hypothetical protein
VVNQSRDNLQIKDVENFNQKLLELLHKACVAILDDRDTAKVARYDTHLQFTNLYDDGGKLSQVRPYPGEHLFHAQTVLFTEQHKLEGFLLTYRPTNGAPSILDLMEKGYDFLLKEKKKPGSVINITSARKAIREKGDVADLVRKWFVFKTYDRAPEKPSGDSDEEDEESPYVHKTSDILELFVSEYINHGKTIGIFLKKLPVVKVRCTHSTFNSYFRHQAMEIHLALGVYTKVEMDEFRDAFFTWVNSEKQFEASMKGTKIFKQMLLPGRGGQGPTVPHELEHLRRADKKKCTGKHGPWKKSILPEDVYDQFREFGDCTNDVYDHLLAHTSFLQDFKDKSRKLIKK